jgi:hypothetical protein
MPSFLPFFCQTLKAHDFGLACGCLPDLRGLVVTAADNTLAFAAKGNVRDKPLLSLKGAKKLCYRGSNRKITNHVAALTDFSALGQEGSLTA